MATYGKASRSVSTTTSLPPVRDDMSGLDGATWSRAAGSCVCPNLLNGTCVVDIRLAELLGHRLYRLFSSSSSAAPPARIQHYQSFLTWWLRGQFRRSTLPRKGKGRIGGHRSRFMTRLVHCLPARRSASSTCRYERAAFQRQLCCLKRKKPNQRLRTSVDQ